MADADAVVTDAVVDDALDVALTLATADAPGPLRGALLLVVPAAARSSGPAFGPGDVPSLDAPPAPSGGARMIDGSTGGGASAGGVVSTPHPPSIASGDMATMKSAAQLVILVLSSTCFVVASFEIVVVILAFVMRELFRARTDAQASSTPAR